GIERMDFTAVKSIGVKLVVFPGSQGIPGLKIFRQDEFATGSENPVSFFQEIPFGRGVTNAFYPGNDVKMVVGECRVTIIHDLEFCQVRYPIFSGIFYSLLYLMGNQGNTLCPAMMVFGHENAGSSYPATRVQHKLVWFDTGFPGYVRV